MMMMMMMMLTSMSSSLVSNLLMTMFLPSYTLVRDTCSRPLHWDTSNMNILKCLDNVSSLFRGRLEAASSPGSPWSSSRRWMRERMAPGSRSWQPGPLHGYYVSIRAINEPSRSLTCEGVASHVPQRYAQHQGHRHPRPGRGAGYLDTCNAVVTCHVY